MDDLLLLVRQEKTLCLLGSHARNLSERYRCLSRDSAANLLAARVDDADDISNHEITIYSGYSHREEAVVTVFKALSRLHVDSNNASESRR